VVGIQVLFVFFLTRKFGFWPRFLTAIMSKSAARREVPLMKFSALCEADQNQALSACRELADSICVKFAAARPGPDAGKVFERLLDVCEALAVEHRSGARLAANGGGRSP
jgi:hypothetical protein